MRILDRLGIKLSILLIALVPMIIGNLAALRLASIARQDEQTALTEVADLEQLLATHDLQLAVSTEATLYRGWTSVSQSAAIDSGATSSASPMTPMFQSATDQGIATFTSVVTEPAAAALLEQLDAVLLDLRSVPIDQTDPADVERLEAIGDQLAARANAIVQGRNAAWETINAQSAFASNLSSESLMIGTLYLAGSSNESARQTAAVLIDRTDASYRALEASLDQPALALLDGALDSSEYMPDLRRQSLDLADEFEPLTFMGLARAFDDLRRLTDVSNEIRADLAAGLRNEATARAAEAQTERQQMFGLAVLALVLPSALVLGVGGRITRRVKRLAEAAERISNGELGVLVDDVSGRDELGLLAGAFNDVSATVSLGHDQIAALADGRLADPVLEREMPGPVGHTLRVALRRLGNTTAELAHHASHDRLTGLLDRRGFHIASSEVDRSNDGVIMLIDLDGFKTVNDTFGHATGDAVLVEVARRLTGATRDRDIVARLGGDEFVVLIKEPDNVDILAQRLADSLAEPVSWESETVAVSASVGWTETNVTEPVEQALERADRAMYQAKRNGKNRVVAIPA